MPIIKEKHPAIPEAPNDDEVIWRFMSFSKFMSLLSTKSLFFPQLKVLKDRDPFEGKFSQVDRQFAEKMETDKDFARAFFRQEHSDIEVVEKLVEHRSFFGVRDLNKSEYVNEQINYVNCWHISPHESAGLWSIYAKEGEGLAVRTTIGRLREAFDNNDRHLYIGQVEYVDFRNTSLVTDNAFYPIYRKRLSFSADQELRICTTEIPEMKGDDTLTKKCHLNPIGLDVSCDIKTLIQELRIAPFAPPWFRDLILDVIKQYNLAIPVSQSSLIDDALI